MKVEVKFILEVEAENQLEAKEKVSEEMSMKGITQFEVRILDEKRTGHQNDTLHLYFTQLAEALNDAGFDLRKTIKEGIDIPWTKDSIKTYLWKPVMKIYLKKKSTTELNKTKDIDAIYKIVNRTIARRTGVSVPFPSIEELTQDPDWLK